MPKTLEKRLKELEKKVAQLSSKSTSRPRQKNPSRTFGLFRGDSDFKEAARLGRKYREQQTYAKELAGS